MEQHLAAARDEVPATVSVTTRAAPRAPGPRLAALADGHYDLVVAGPRPAGRLRRLFGRSVTHAPAVAQRHIGARRQVLSRPQSRAGSHARRAGGTPSRTTLASISP